MMCVKGVQSITDYRRSQSKWFLLITVRIIGSLHIVESINVIKINDVLERGLSDSTRSTRTLSKIISGVFKRDRGVAIGVSDACDLIFELSAERIFNKFSVD